MPYALPVICHRFRLFGAIPMKHNAHVIDFYTLLTLSAKKANRPMAEFTYWTALQKELGYDLPG